MNIVIFEGVFVATVKVYTRMLQNEWTVAVTQNRFSILVTNQLITPRVYDRLLNTGTCLTSAKVGEYVDPNQHISSQ